MARAAIRGAGMLAVVVASGFLAGCGLGDLGSLDFSGVGSGGSYYKGTLDLVNTDADHVAVEVMGDPEAALAPGDGVALEVEAGEVPIVVVWEDGVVTEQTVRVGTGEAVAVRLGR